MKGTALSRLGNTDDIRPEDVERQIQIALNEGVTYDELAENTALQGVIHHLLSDFERRKEQFAPNSIRRLQSAWNLFVAWCEQTNKHALPTTPRNVEEYIEHRALTCHRNTVSVDLWSISKTHRIAGCPDPTVTERIKGVMKKIARKKTETDERVKQATPFNDEHLDALTAIWQNSASLIDLRDLALMTVAYESMLRESELANVKISHLTYAFDGGAVLTIYKTKTNQSGGPQSSFLSPNAMAVVDAYLEKANIDKSCKGGYLFRKVSRHNVSVKPKVIPDTNIEIHKPLSTKAIEYVFLKAWFALHPQITPMKPNDEGFKAFKKQYRPFTGHSARVGAAQDLLSQGFDVLQVQQSGRWKSNTMVAQYGQHILARDSAMARSRAKKNNQS
ncbi:tyrosine-type recombinase/integrase [Enterovibrio norvegicus]|uniref:tyrosine-type recombinase/integrase n=1 Tax=Enterovibrio norvegicus TaxID=188144 RepID=UPI000C8676E3|nr:tyrosine-type recombinase/integrase [Enterovibrio norvegicus]PMH64501.1 hypothetical protein BCU62_15720 [Enterovibrio norvegicus]